MAPKQIDLLNIGLILISAILAYNFPLEVFVLALAILGPLHYLTEINWLNSKSFYTKKKSIIWLSVGVICTILIVAPKLYFALSNDIDSFLYHFVTLVNNWSNSVIFLSLIMAIGVIYFKKLTTWVGIILIGIIGAILLNSNEDYSIIIGLLIPTVIHVYVFTLIFMMFGAIKSKSSLGYLSVLLAIMVPIIFISVDVDSSSYLFSDSMKANYLDNNLHFTPVLFSKFLGISDGTTFFFYEQMELRLMMFMSFIYLYHYLNWFSKTTTIGWHKQLTAKKTISIFFLWFLMVVLFFIDYSTGFLVALFFSFLHVILEFPLNIISTIGLFKTSKKD